MSALLEATDDVLTLEEVLAFIDAADSEDSNSGSSDSQLQYDSIKTGCLTKRKRGNLSSSTRLQQRKKAELLYLRRLVQELEAQVDKLQTSTPQSQTNEDGISTQTTQYDGPTWMTLAETQYRARLESEETNRILKEIVNVQLRTSGVMRDVLHMQTSYSAVFNDPGL